MSIAADRGRVDEEIQRDVLAELNRDWRFTPAELGVEVDDGVVTLVGTVSSHAKIKVAGEVAAQVTGVKDVASKLTVELPGEWRHDDTKIASVIREALIWDVDVPEERIDAIVRSGAVTLKGTVDHWQQRERAAEIVSHVIGVTRVDNDILVAAAARSDREIHDDVNSALRRRLPSASDIDVVVEDGRVVVMGTVPSLAARSDATSVVLSTAGVRTVSDRIVVARQGRLRERHERAARTALVGR